MTSHCPAGHWRPCRRSGDPPRRGPEGKMELTEVARLPIAPEGIPEVLPPGRARKGRSERQRADGRQGGASYAFRLIAAVDKHEVRLGGAERGRIAASQFCRLLP